MVIECLEYRCCDSYSEWRTGVLSSGTGRPYSSIQSIHTTGTVRDWDMILSNGEAIVIIVIMIRKECQK